MGHRFYDGEGGFASHVSVNDVRALAFHPITEDLYIVDQALHIVRKIDKLSGVITTVAGTVGVEGFSGDGGPATSAQLREPCSIAFSLDGQSMYIADSYNNRVRVVKDGIITTVVGNGEFGFEGDGGPATSAQMGVPTCVTVLPTTGELVISAKWSHRIRKVDSNGIIYTVAGTGISTNLDGSNLGDNGPAINATLSYPEAIVANAKGEIFISDVSNGRIRKIGTDGVITTIAVNDAEMNYVRGMAMNSAGDLFFAEHHHSSIRKIDNATQIITTVAGSYG